MVIRRKSPEEYNSYLFMVMAHEYLHSFGIVDELQIRNLIYLCKSLLGCIIAVATGTS